ncbi:AHL_G0046210.mRNA.1.CDS.1 [Saccharomyces cerevisiae]|nr:Ypt53p [Saccharomyces cerevisiae YJM1252]CAI4898889.1 AHL_G0046210.mRNA.1.CDS.1 [Saccharomyces cerevisiae]CAI6863945.1 AHL_G0046210.mRNA.1.CDS.1 [Saccharomyces cerevisiae]
MDKHTAAIPTLTIKVVLLGESAVGKSSIVLRFVSDDFKESKEPTIGAAFLTKRITRDGKVIKFEIWDTAGQERFAPLAPMYYRNAQAALVVFDVTNEGSFYKAQNWVEELREKVGHDIVIALVGNKMDLLNNDDENENRAMKAPAVQNLCERENLLYFEASAKTGENIYQIFQTLGEKVPCPEQNTRQSSTHDRTITDNQRIDLESTTVESTRETGGCNC